MILNLASTADWFDARYATKRVRRNPMVVKINVKIPYRIGIAGFSG
jgi:hypothetical protein